MATRTSPRKKSHPPVPTTPTAAASPLKRRTSSSSSSAPAATRSPNKSTKKSTTTTAAMEDDDEDEPEEESKEPSSKHPSTASSNVPTRFSGMSLYAVLGIEKSATQEVIKKAYRRMALTCHPDLNKSASATEEFQYLSRCHEILSNPNKRALYDRSGSIDDAGEGSDENIDAYEYWRTIFPKITIDDIESYRKKYEGSADEKEDLLAAYEQFGKDDLQSIFESVPFASSLSVTRLCTILNNLTNAKISRKVQNDLQRTLVEMEGDESAEAEEALQQLSKKDQALLRSGSANGSTDSLALLIQQRGRDRAKQGQAFLSQMETKYAAMEDDEPIIYANKKKSSSNKKSSSSTSSTPSKRKTTSTTATVDADDEGDVVMGEPTEDEFAAIQARIEAERAQKKAAREARASPKKKAKK